MAIELRQIVRHKRVGVLQRLGVPRIPSLFVVLAVASVVLGIALSPMSGFLLFFVGSVVLGNWLDKVDSRARPREVVHEQSALLGRDGLRHRTGFVPRSEMRVFEATRDVVTIKTYGGERFELTGTPKALAEAKHLASARLEGTRDEELEKLVVRAAEQPRASGPGYRAGQLVSPEQVLAVVEDPRCPPKVRIAALTLAPDEPDVRVRIEAVADDTAHPEVEAALRAAVRRD